MFEIDQISPFNLGQKQNVLMTTFFRKIDHERSVFVKKAKNKFKNTYFSSPFFSKNGKKWAWQQGIFEKRKTLFTLVNRGRFELF